MRNKLKERLLFFDQAQLVQDIDSMSESDVMRCLEQIQKWDDAVIDEQKKSWQVRRSPLAFEPLANCLEARDQIVGTQPRVGVLILAGGQGSRLGIDGPKGCFPLLGKSLFEWHAEKIRVKQAPLAVLTSSLNHLDTVQFFKKNEMFGLQDVSFFFQQTLPLFDESGRWFWQECGRIAEGADGNGTVFQSFVQSGCWDHFLQQNVQAVQIIPVDNPLADPFEPVFLSFHHASQADLSVKCFRLTDANEPTGRLVRQGSQLAIAEFAELDEIQRQNNLLANTGLLAIDLFLVRQLAFEQFPLHWAFRSAVHWEHGMSTKKNSWKGERFIVDALRYAKNGQAICYPRDACYAPLKEKNLIHAIETNLLLRERINRV